MHVLRFIFFFSQSQRFENKLFIFIFIFKILLNTYMHILTLIFSMYLFNRRNRSFQEATEDLGVVPTSDMNIIFAMTHF